MPQGEAPLPTGAHGIRRSYGRLHSQGFVTSSYQSPTLGRPVALGLIERGAARHGEAIEIQHLGKVTALNAFIARGTTLDPSQASASAALSFAGINAVVYRHQDRLRVHVDRGLAAYLWTWMEQAAGHIAAGSSN